MAARAAMMPTQDHPARDPSIRLQRIPSQTSRGKNTLSPKDDSLNVGAGTTDLSNLSGNPSATSPLAQSFEMSRSTSKGLIRDDYSDYPESATSIHGDSGLQRSPSAASIGRSNTLRKQRSISRKSSMRRSSSKRSARAGSIGGITYDDTSGEDSRSVYSTPIPTSGSPTDVLASRFLAWRKFLKELVGYFRDVQSTYEVRAKQLTKVSNTIGNITMPPGFLGQGGLGDALSILRNHHKEALAETSKAREIETDVINQLTVLRSDLGQKIKEIKALSGDFRNTIEKEKDNTKKIVGALQEAIAAVDTNTKAMVGKDDPYIVRLAVERQVERQIDEENFLHRAYLNLEGSGRELEAIVVGEVQKALSAFATILRKEADDSYDTVERLRKGPVALPKDLEWSEFIVRDPHFVSPDTPLRRAQDLEYPGKHHPSAAEVRAGMLERKSKYLKSYTPGWFVLSPTHIHEFKSADGVYTQPPVMSLYLLDQKLGAHSQPGSSSHKFILKGRQTGGMHRGHSWVFRAETYDTMLAWYDDIKSLTEKTGEERQRFIRGHARSVSARSTTSMSSFEDDEADEVPYSTEAAAALHRNTSINGSIARSTDQQRPQPGGRFPSDLQVGNRDLPSRLSGSSSESARDVTNLGGSYAAVNAHNNRDVGNSMESTKDQRSLRNLEGALYISEHRIDPYPSASSTAPQQSKSMHTSVGKSVLHQDEPETPLESNIREPDHYRVHQSPERPVQTRIHEAGTYAYHTAPIESYPPPAVGAAEMHNSENGYMSRKSTTYDAEPKLARMVSSEEKMVAEKAPTPGLSRNDTEGSISNLHIPGEFPQTPRASIAR